jgi:glutamate racemase
MQIQGSIGVFDSGYGGLTILKEIVKKLPQYNYIYLGDNARTPYGNRSFETVHQYTQQCVEWFFNNGCNLVILACNTASAKALKTIQQNYIAIHHPNKRVLGVIRPTTEIIGTYTKSNHIGILATNGTVSSNSYPIEISNFFPNIKVHQQACAMWVSLIENNEHNSKGADYFVKKYIDALDKQNPNIDTILLACTHYPLLLNKIKEYTPIGTKIITQGEIVANSLATYLQKHTLLETLCSKGTERKFYTTDATDDFDKHAAIFYGERIKSLHCHL